MDGNRRNALAVFFCDIRVFFFSGVDADTDLQEYNGVPVSVYLPTLGMIFWSRYLGKV